MENKKWFYMPVIIIAVISILFCTGGTLYGVTAPESSVILRLASLANLSALVSALYYIFRGCKKDAAKTFRIFLYFASFAEFVAMVFSTTLANSTITSVYIALGALSYGFVLVLATGKDLGKVVSLSLSVITLVIQIALIVIMALALKEEGVIHTLYVLHTYTSSVIALIILILEYAKYVDKASRGSK